MDKESTTAKKVRVWWTVLKIALVVAAVAFAAYKIYTKFFKKNKIDELDAETPDALNEADADAPAKEAAFEVSAQDAIANPEDAAE